jgi:hypothetical protein
MHSFTRLLRKTAASAMLLALPAAPTFAQDWDDHGGHRIRHVFVIVLENEGYDVTFGPASKAPYLSQTLVSQGVLLSQYYGTGHVSLDNYMAMISGQAGTLATHADCQTYTDFVQTGITPDGQAIGTGCVYPAGIKTLPDQLKAVGKTWRGYMEDMGNDPARESAKCGHPQLNTLDLTQSPEKPSPTVPQGDQYASRHDPFVYFHSIVDSADCEQNVVNLNHLTQDLKSENTTPNFVFITPNLCNDGHDAPCVNGQPGGLVSADAFLKKWVPIITSSPAYKEDGLLVINFDEGGFTLSKSSTGGTVITFPGQFCCNEQPGPNAATFPQSTNLGPFTLVYGNYGGDRTGAVLLSPFLKPGTVSEIPYNHYSFLKTLEDIYETKGYLGYAGQPGSQGFFGCVNSDIQTKTGDQFATCHKW